MKSLIFAIIISFFAAGSVARAELGVLGFQAWKTSRIDEAKLNLERLSTQDKAVFDGKKDGAKSAAATARLQLAGKTGRSDQKIQQAQINLEIAQELTVNDYFVLYLSQYKQKEAYVEAAKKLSPDESADLMMALQKRLAGSEQPEVAPGSGLVGTTAVK